MDTVDTNIDTNETSKSSNTCSPRSAVVRSALTLLEDQREFRTVKMLGRGSYGDVYQMKRRVPNTEQDSSIAVKIVTSNCIAAPELAYWPRLNHPNIVRLLEMFSLKSLDATIFIMPLQKTDLREMLLRKEFGMEPDALEKVRGCLYDVLRGLEYLHSKDLCHLDLKVDNVLISHSSSAMICDFSFLNSTKKKLYAR